MDYPISVPGVGLVDGKFVDEDQVNGTPGSLIPSAWGNAVTDELISVIEAAGFAADETKSDQLLTAIRALSGVVSRTVAVSSALSATQLGLVLVNAAAGAVTVTLPAAADGLRVVLRRIDVTANSVVVAAAAADKLMLDTTAQAAGQANTELLFAGDYLCLQADSAGRWWCVGQAQLPASLDSGLVVYGAPGSFTFTVPAVLRSGRRRPKVTVIGGGGGGGGASASANYNAGAGGGGAGGTAIRLVSLAAVSSVPVTVGAGGTGGPNGSTVGTSSATSSFGAFCSATGGAAGNPVSGGTASAGCASGGPGGGSAGGDINAQGGGGQGGVAQYAPLAGSTVGGGHGGVSSFSGGTAYGSGGAGGGSVANVVAGQSGAAGAVIIEW